MKRGISHRARPRTQKAEPARDYQYEPLPADDGIRVFSLEPGEFDSALRGSLSPVPFSARPAYVALSYTWLDRDSRHALIELPPAICAPQSSLPFMWLDNGGDQGPTRFPIGRNLALALVHLRPRSGPPLKLWIDQICINQADMAERAAQVALMGFVYQRSRLVVCWLGVSEDGLRSIGRGVYEWGALKACHKRIRPNGLGLALSQAPRTPGIPPDDADRHRTLRDPDFFHKEERGLSLDSTNPYWQRIWIVQEVCLAPEVAFLEGPYLWSENQVANAGRLVDKLVEIDWIKKLVEARAGRFSQEMRLEALIERFRECGCGELRDKLFALIGLAHDAWAVTATQEIVEEGDIEPRRARETPDHGEGGLRIDYERSFFDIWRDAVSFVRWRASPNPEFNESSDLDEEDRKERVVRFAGMLQLAFAGKVGEEMAARTQPPAEQLSRRSASLAISTHGHNRFVLAKGYIAGKILHLGPTYEEFVGSHRKHSDWVRSWIGHYPDTIRLEHLREMEEGFRLKIVDQYDEADVARVRAFSGKSSCFAYSPLKPNGRRLGQELAQSVSASVPDSAPESSPEPPLSGPPRRFLGTDLCVGMVPWEAQVGDFIVRFWNCNAAIVVRPPTVSFPTAEPGDQARNGKREEMTEQPGIYSIIGRADVAEHRAMLGDPRAKNKLEVLGAHLIDGEYVAAAITACPTTDAVYVHMDFETLQKVSEALTIIRE